MKTLGKLKVNSNKLLTNDELQTLKGGMMCFYDCSCVGSANPPYSGTFSIAVTSAEEIADAIDQHCATEGHCTQAFCM
jgi:hypothetical protein